MNEQLRLDTPMEQACTCGGCPVHDNLNIEPQPPGNTLEDQDELWDEFVRDSFYSRMSKAELKSKYLITRK